MQLKLMVCMQNANACSCHLIANAVSLRYVNSEPIVYIITGYNVQPVDVSFRSNSYVKGFLLLFELIKNTAKC